MRKQPVHEQVVVITGASSGLGRAVAREAGRRGARVVLAGRNGDALASAAAEIEAGGGEALAVSTDVTAREQVDALAAEAVERFGGIHTWVDNAMVTVYAEIEHLAEDELRRVIETNFFGSISGFWAALPHLKRSRGTFVNVNSALAYRGIPLQAAYCASKAALRTFYESARVELEKHGAGVDICVILPAAINTPQFDRGRQKLGLQPKPVPPIYQPEPFAEAIVHMFEQPARELPVGWGAQKLLWGQKLSPRAGDFVLRRTGWSSQTTGTLKPVEGPDNLFETLPGDPGAHGRFDAQAKGSTAWTSLRLRRGQLAVLGLVGVAATLARMRSRSG